MQTIRNRINKFYKSYGVTTVKLSRADMRNHTALMTAYEDMWFTMDEYGDNLTADEYAWLSKTYGDLGDYITNIKNKGEIVMKKLFNPFAMFFGGFGLAASILYLGLFGIDFQGVALAVLSVAVTAIVTVRVLKGCE